MPSLAPPAALRQLRAALFALPPDLRFSVAQNPSSRRCFSATTFRSATWTDWAVAAPSAALDTVHACGIPWYAAIPITAVLVRGTLGYYVTTLPARQREIVRRHLFPLSYARGRMQQASIEQRSQKSRHKHRHNSMIPQKWSALGTWALTRLGYVRESHRTGKEFGAPLISWRTFFNFGMMIAFVEALRIKCGSREGLLSLIFGSTQQVKDAASEAGRAVAHLSPDELLAHRLELAQAAQQAKLDDPSNSVDTALDAAQAAATNVHVAPLDLNAYATFLDSTMRTEGLGWMQDLTLPDTSFVLPLTMSALIAANVLIRPVGVSKSTTDKSTTTDQLQFQAGSEVSAGPSRTAAKGEVDIAAALAAADKLNQDLGRRAQSSKGPLAHLTLGQRFGLSMALLFFVVASKLPVAILLYIIPTIATGFVQRRWLDVMHPLPETLTPCNRPLRVKVRREASDG